MIRHYFNMALRVLSANKTKTIISILGLVAGIFCFTTTNYYARAFYRNDAVFPEFDRMARIYMKYEGRIGFVAKTKDVPAGKEDISQVIDMNFPEISYYASYNPSVAHNIEWTDATGNQVLYNASAMEVSSDFFKIYPGAFLEGREDLFADRPLTAVVTRSFSLQLGLGESVLGKTFTLISRRNEAIEDSQTYTIAGVIDDYPAFTSFTLGRNPELFIKSGLGNECTFLMHPGTQLDALNDRLQKIETHTRMKDVSNEMKFDWIKDQRQIPLQFGIIGFIGFLVMLTGVINFLSFSVGSFLNRNRELSLRKTLGGQNFHLFLLLFTELFIIVTCAILIVIAVSELLYPWLISLLAGNMSIFTIDIPYAMRHNVEYGLWIMLFCSIIAFLAVARLKLQKSLIDMRRGNSTGRKHRMRNTLLGLQVFIGMIFLICVGASIAQMHHAAHEHEIELHNNNAIRNIHLPIYQEYTLKQNGYNILQFVSSQKWTEAAGAMHYDATEYHSNGQSRRIRMATVTPGYAEFSSYPELKEAIATEKEFCLVNESLRRLLEQDSIAGYFPAAGQTYTITGNIGDEGDPCAYVPYIDGPLSNLYLRVRPEANLDSVKAELSRYISNFIPVNYHFPIQTVNETEELIHQAYRLLFWVFAVCALISILISTLGIYGAVALDTERRRKEIAIRKVNGAGLKEIGWLFGRLYLSLYLFAAVLSGLIGWAVLRAMSSVPELFHQMFNPNHPLLWISVYGTSALIVFLTVYFRIRRSSEQNPAETIKSE